MDYFSFAKTDVSISFMGKLLHFLDYANSSAYYNWEVKIINLNG